MSQDIGDLLAKHLIIPMSALKLEQKDKLTIWWKTFKFVSKSKTLLSSAMNLKKTHNKTNTKQNKPKPTNKQKKMQNQTKPKHSSDAATPSCCLFLQRQFFVMQKE